MFKWTFGRDNALDKYDRVLQAFAGLRRREDVYPMRSFMTDTAMHYDYVVQKPKSCISEYRPVRSALSILKPVVGMEIEAYRGKHWSCC